MSQIEELKWGLIVDLQTLNNIGYVVHCYSFLFIYLLMTYIINKYKTTQVKSSNHPFIALGQRLT